MHTPRIIHFHPNGKFASIFVDPLIAAERSCGFTSYLVTSANLSGSGGTLIAYDLSFRNLPGLLIAFFKICLFLRAEKPNVVVSHNAKSSSLPLFAAWLIGVRSRIYYNHGVPFIAYRGILRYLLMWLERINCALATEIVTVSPGMRSILLDLMPAAKVLLIGPGSACGIDLNKYNESLYAKSSFRKDHGIDKDDFVVVFVGRPERRKGYELVLRLWQDYFIEDEYKLILCGSDVSDALKILPKIPRNIICLGFANNIPEILSNSNCLVLPSLHEGLSYALLEAMACGCLVAANDIEGIRSLICSGENGYLIKGNAASGYASLIRSIRNPTQETSVVRKKSLETVQQYSREQFIPFYLAFIERLLAGTK